MKEAGTELAKLMLEEKLKNVPVLVFANKQDLVHALGPEEIEEMIQLHKMIARKWTIVACSAMSKDGLTEGRHGSR